MKYLNLDIVTLRSERYLGVEPVDRATWLCLLAYCADQENGGIIKGCKEWPCRKWSQLCGVLRVEIERECDLWGWAGHSLHVWGYPRDQEKAIRAKRKAGKKFGRTRSNELTDSLANSSANSSPIAKQQRNSNSKGKEKEKEKEGKDTHAYRAFAHLSITQEEFGKLRVKWTKDQIDYTLDQIENFANNKKYTSLYLTANNWLKREYPEGGDIFKPPPGYRGVS